MCSEMTDVFGMMNVPKDIDERQDSDVEAFWFVAGPLWMSFCLSQDRALQKVGLSFIHPSVSEACILRAAVALGMRKLTSEVLLMALEAASWDWKVKTHSFAQDFTLHLLILSCFDYIFAPSFYDLIVRISYCL